MAYGDDGVNIPITTTADTSGIVETQTALKNLEAETQSAGQTTRAYNADLDASAAAAMRGGAQFRVLTVEERAANAAAAEGAAAQTAYNDALATVDLRLGQVIRQEVSRATGLRAAGAAAAGLAEGTAAEVAGLSALTLAIGGAIAAGVALGGAGLLVVKGLNDQTNAAIEAGKAYDDYVAARNKLIVTAPTGQDAVTNATVASRIAIGDLEEQIKKGTTTTKDSYDAMGNYVGQVEEVTTVSLTAANATGQLAAEQLKLQNINKEVATDRDKLPNSQKETDQIAKVQQEFNQRALEALPPLQQQAQAAKNVADELQRAKDALSHLAGGTAPAQSLLAGVDKFQDLKDLIPQLSDAAQRMAAGFADGGLKLEAFAEKAKDAVDKVNKAEADDQKAATDSIAADQQKLLELGVKQSDVAQALSLRNGEVTKSKNAGAEAALRALAYDQATGKTNQEIATLTADILAKNLEIEASVKRQSDAQKALKDFLTQQKINALPQDSQAQIKDIDASLKNLSKIAPEDPDQQANLADNTARLRLLRKGVTDGTPLTHPGDDDGPAIEGPLLPGQVPLGTRQNVNPVAPGDTDNPFGASTVDVANAVRTAQTTANQTVQLVSAALDSVSASYTDGLSGILAAVLKLQTQASATAGKIQQQVAQNTVDIENGYNTSGGNE